MTDLNYSSGPADDASDLRSDSCCRLESLAITMLPAGVWLFGTVVTSLLAMTGLLQWPFVVEFVFVGVFIAVATFLGSVPLVMLSTKDAERLPVAALFSMVIRGSLTVLGVVAILQFGWIAKNTTVAASCIWYVGMLVIELIALARYLSRLFPDSAPSSREISQ